MICPTGEAKYFCKGDWTQNCPTGKSPAANQFIRPVELVRKCAEKSDPGSNLAVSRRDRASQHVAVAKLVSGPIQALL
jgi:hypothetical protein